MRLLVLSYWGLHDGLTQGAVMPHLQVLNEMPDVQQVLLVTLERDNSPLPTPGLPLSLPGKVRHRPIFLKSYKLNLLTKALDFIMLPKCLTQILRKERVDCVIGVGTLSGALLHLSAPTLGIPYIVAFFEPHAAYMLENEVWKTYDPRYVFQEKWERKQATVATGLLVVSEAYKQELVNTNTVPEQKVFVARNTIEGKLFSFSETQRRLVRKRLNVSEGATIGIYVGKYGGLYYEQEAFGIYKRCFASVPNFRLVILSPQSQEDIRQYLDQYQIDKAKVYIAAVPHADVPQYLSAADFAFATIKSYPSARHCSPIKVGEYWANGLPVLLTEGVGDDSDIIQREGGGATFNLQQEGSLEKALEKIQQILQDPNHRQEIPKLAAKYRSPERIREAYEFFFGKAQEGQT